MNKIELIQVSKVFSNSTTPVVEDCSLAIEEGSFVVILGPSGSGKTTLLKMVNRLYEPTRGRILVDGQDIATLEATQLRRRIGYVIQQVGLFPHLNVARNAAVALELAGWSKTHIRERVDELLNMVGLPPQDYRSRFPAQLSGGEGQRVGLARALAGDPGILLMDEPFGAIDAINRGKLQEEMLTLHRQLNKTILFVTHDVDEALRLADRIAVMRDGRILQYARPLEVLTRPADSFVGELIGSEDILRRLSLMRAGAMMQPPPVVPGTDFKAVVQCDDSARLVLSLILSQGLDRVAVYDREQYCGVLSLERIREFCRTEDGGMPGL